MKKRDKPVSKGQPLLKQSGDFINSGKEGLKEAYLFTVDQNHRIKFARDVKKR